MKKFILLFLSFILFISANVHPQVSRGYFVLNIDSIGYQKLHAIEKETKGVYWFIELDDKLFVYAEKKVVESLGIKFTPVNACSRNAKTLSDLYILRHVHENVEKELKDVRVLMKGIGYALIQIETSPQLFIESIAPHDKLIGGIMKAEPNMILARQTSNFPEMKFSSTAIQNDDAISKLVSKVNADRWFASVSKLSTWYRNTGNPEIHKAKEWLIEQMKAIPGVEVYTEAWQTSSYKGENVIAKITGKTKPDEWYIAGAHYDSIVYGAEDNGSGAAGILEMLHAFASNPPNQTIIFICYSGEEQGLLGSTANAQNLVAKGNDKKVKLALVMDMIGWKKAASDYRVIMETSRTYAAILEPFVLAAEKYTQGLKTTISYNPFGSDHVSYLRRNMPAFLAIDADWSSYPHYHKATDLPEHLVKRMAEFILQMNVGGLAIHLGY